MDASHPLMSEVERAEVDPPDRRRDCQRMVSHAGKPLEIPAFRDYMNAGPQVAKTWAI